MIPIFSNQKIRIEYNTATNVILQLRGQVKLSTGEIVDITETKVVSGITPGSITTGSFEKNVPEGELLTFTLKTPTAGIVRGMTYVRVDVLYNADNFVIAGICAKYITTSSAVFIGQFEDSTSGRGWITSIEVTDPAAGTPASVSFSDDVISSLQVISLTLTTGAAAANRKCKIYHDDGLRSHYIGIQVGSQPASTVYEYSFGNNITSNETSLVTNKTLIENIAFPYVLPNNSSLLIDFENIQAADQISSLTLFIEQWIKA